MYRPTPLPTDLNGWIDSLGTQFLDAVRDDQRAAVRQEVVEECRPVLCDEEGVWWADYVRLRFVAEAI